MQGTITLLTHQYLEIREHYLEEINTLTSMGFTHLPEQSQKIADGGEGKQFYSHAFALAYDAAHPEKVLELIAYATKNGYTVTALTLPVPQQKPGKAA